MTYEKFPHKELTRDWEKLMKQDRNFLIELEEQWEEINERNNTLSKEVYKERNEKQKEITTALRSIGVEPGKYDRRSFPPKFKGYKAWFENNVMKELYAKYPSYGEHVPKGYVGEREVNGVLLHNGKSPIGIVELYDNIKHKYAQLIKKANKEDQLLVASIQYATANEVDIEGLDSTGIVQRVNEVAKDNYREKNFPEGETVELDHQCGMCSEYTVGERRCSCGNRRIYIEVEGDIIGGFYGYPEPF